MKNSITSTFEVTWKKTRFSYSRQSDSLKFLYSNSFKWQFLRGISYVLYWNFVFFWNAMIIGFFFNSSFNFNEWLLVVPQFLSVCNSFTWIHICNVQFRINTNKENPRVVFLIYELGISIYTAGKCAILQVTCFPLG